MNKNRKKTQEIQKVLGLRSAPHEKKPKKSKDEPRISNAKEYEFPQVTRGNRGEMRRDTERRGLQNIELLHTTPSNNIRHKKSAIFQFWKYKGKKPEDKGYYYCDLKDGYAIQVIETDAPGKMRFHAFYVLTKPDPIGISSRRELRAYGDSYTDAVARLMGIPQFRNPFSARQLSFFDLCDPHIRMGSKQGKTAPSNPGPIPTQRWVNQQNDIPNDLGTEAPRRQFVLPHGKYKSFEQLRLAWVEAQEQLQKAPHPIPPDAKAELEELLGNTNRI